MDRITNTRTKYLLYSAATLVAAALAACDYLPTAENKAKQAVARRLIDPESARFEFVEPGRQSGDFCGYVNGKNRMGGFAGATPFIYFAKNKDVLIVREIPSRQTFKNYYLKLSAGATEAGDIEEIISACQFPDNWAKSCTSPFPVKAHPLCKSAIAGTSAFVDKLFDEVGR